MKMYMYLLSLTTGSMQGEKASKCWQMIYHRLKGHLDINGVSAVVGINYSGAESECGCVLTDSTHSAMCGF